MEFHIALIFYILGGVTFVPIVLCALVLLLYIRSSFIQWNRIEDSVPALDNTCYKDSVNNSYGTWITLSETYEEELLDDESKVPSISSDETFSKHKTAYSSLFKLVNGTVKASNPDLASEKRTSMSADIPSGRVTVFAVVRQGNLYLYSDATESDIRHVIVLSNYFITLWPPNFPNGELFLKKSCICLIKLNRRFILREYRHNTPKDAIYLYINNCSDKEDFYFALIRSAALHSREFNARGLHDINPSLVAQVLELNHKDVTALLDLLQHTEARYQWHNALLGRLFLAIKGTDEFNRFIRARIERKLERLKLPGFITDLKLKEIGLDGVLPNWNEIQVKELVEDGTLILDSMLTYSGGFCVRLSANLEFKFGSTIRTRHLPLELSIRLLKLQGRLVIKIKAPPSSRIWYGFESMPTIALQILPSINSRSVAIPVITNSIERKLKEAIRDSIVLPHMDDVAFFEVSSELYKGGIWKTPSSEHCDGGDVKPNNDGGDTLQYPSIPVSEEMKTCSQTAKTQNNNGGGEMAKCHVSDEIKDRCISESVGIFDAVTADESVLHNDSETLPQNSSQLRHRDHAA